MKITGIDYSLNSPAICNFDSETNKKVYHFFAQKKTQIGTFHKGMFIGHQVEKMQGMMRYDFNSDWVLGIIKDFKPDLVAIEDYSYMSVSSSMLSLAENGGILRYKLYKNGIDYKPLAPTYIKKIATGKGNSDKQKMYQAWIQFEKIDLASILGTKQHGNPVSDIVDSRFVVLAATQNQFTVIGAPLR